MNIVYRVQQESANSAGVPDPNLEITIVSNDSSDVLCYAGRTTALKYVAGSAFPGDCSKATKGDMIQVRATYRFTPITKQMIGILGTDAFQMRKAVRMVIV